MGLDISIYIDDSGQLHTKSKSDYFIYGGFYSETQYVNGLSRTYGTKMSQIYQTKKEFKTDRMKDKDKRKVLRKMFKEHSETLNPIYVAAYIPDITIDFSNPSVVQLHKNFMIRRLVEDVINKITKEGHSIDKLRVFIDNQSQTDVKNRDNLKDYIKKYFSNSGSYLLQSFTTTTADIELDFLESHAYRPMQIADFFANTKYCRYEHDCHDYKNIINDEYSMTPLCRKHPKYFTK